MEKRPDGVVVLTLSLPERRNAMTAELTESWRTAVTGLQGDRSVRCVVVTGSGSAFSAGGDMSFLRGEPGLTVDRLRDRMYPFYRTWLAIRAVEVPTIAAINGHAVGAGLALALACDLRYLAAGARLSVPFAGLGLHPGMATTWTLPEVVGLPRARELLFTGRAVEAEEAAAIGLVNGVFPREELMAQTLAVAARIAQQAPVALRLTTAALRRGHASLEAALEWEALAQPVTLATADLQEGLTAQSERRPPRFEGR
jgi:enoyl-CoA hydratase